MLLGVGEWRVRLAGQFVLAFSGREVGGGAVEHISERGGSVLVTIGGFNPFETSIDSDHS